MANTDRMVVWLREAMDAAQHDAEAAGGDAWSVVEGARLLDARDGQLVEVGREPGTRIIGGGRLIATGPALVLPHIARQDPAAVLRRIAADRQILDLHADNGYGECTTCSAPDCTAEVNGVEYEMLAHAPSPCTTVRLLAEGWGWTTGE
ncbi:DUF6221 family protein [Streptomyces sp. NPDC020801]|uniref:DUF6221 family protein n=1 Tax=Streptomyces sp. NPDC020801 TaxID=3365093 RepID=UPI0037A5D72A